jgi:ethanolamine utilization protein EutN
MIIGKVSGTVVCTQKDPSLVGKKLLVVQPLKLTDLQESGSPMVALDAVGAGIGEVVMLVGGSSARMADNFAKVSVDQSIIGIIDMVEINGKIIFTKFEESDP